MACYPKCLDTFPWARFEPLSGHLHQLDPQALGALAHWLSDQAAHARRLRADLLERARRTGAALKAKPWTEGVGERALDLGAKAVALELDCDLRLVTGLRDRARRRLRLERRDRRDREIMRMATRGWSNARIGRRLALSASQVSRIVQRRLRESARARIL